MTWGLGRLEPGSVKQRTQWYAYIRLLFLLAIAVPGLLSLYLFRGWSTSVRIDIAIVVLAIVSNLVFYGLTTLADNQRYLRVLAAGWICFDVILIAFFILLNGGIESRSTILFAVPILISAALFGRRGLYVTALLGALLYASLILGGYFGLVSSSGGFDPELQTNLQYVVNTVSFVPAIIIVVALAVDFITSLLAEKQSQLTDTIRALENAQETAKLGSWEWDIKRDEITWSRELYRIYDIEPSDKKLTFARYLKMQNDDEADSHKAVILNAMKHKTAFKVDHEITLPNGTIRYLHGEGRPVKDKGGKVTKMIGTAQDVTDIYHLDVAKREFVSLASHQLRTPASGVKAFLSLLLDGHGGTLSRPQQNFIRQAYDANNRQLEIIDNLLSLAAIESGKLTLHREPIDLKSLVKQNLPAYKAHAKARKQRLTLHQPREKIMVNADTGALLMALDNLVSNASKYTPESGRISVRTRTSKANAYIDVTDTGIGIARVDIPQLFQKFTRLSDPASKTVGGSGVGLYMAKYIVELHDGRVMVRSKHGTGTTFTIKLPLLTQKAVK
mgnify:CR=1 FL=1